jgi:hypothetical protein
MYYAKARSLQYANIGGSMNNLEYIGIHVDGRSELDEKVLEFISDYIKEAVYRIDTRVKKINRITLAEELGTDRQRISRICKTLGITHIFDDCAKK